MFFFFQVAVYLFVLCGGMWCIGVSSSHAWLWGRLFFWFELFFCLCWDEEAGFFSSCCMLGGDALTFRFISSKDARREVEELIELQLAAKCYIVYFC
jgi:hypothetical protein